MTDRRRAPDAATPIWITGIGVITAIGTGRDAFRAGLRAAPLAGPADRPLRPVAVPLAGRGPGRRLRPARLDAAQDRPPARPVQPVRAGRRPAGPRRRAPHAGRRRRAPHPQRIGIYLGSALGGIAYAEEQHERYLERGIRQVAPNLALAVFGGAAPANLGIALDVRGPILSTANSCASGAVALGEALGDLREGRIDAAIAGGCEIPLSPLAFGAFDIIRALSAGSQRRPGPRRAAVRRGPRRLRHGRGRGAARPRGGRGRRRRAAPSRTPSCWATARPPTRTTWSSRGPTAPRPRARRRSPSTTPASTPDEIDYVNAHASSTPIGDVAEARAIALALGDARGDGPGQRDEGAVRPSARGVGRDRGGHLRAGDPRRLGAGVGQPRRPGPGRGGPAARPAARGPRRRLPARAVDLVRVRRAQRGARVRGRRGLTPRRVDQRVRAPAGTIPLDRRGRLDRLSGAARTRRADPRPGRPSPISSVSTPPIAIATVTPNAEAMAPERQPADRHRCARRPSCRRSSPGRGAGPGRPAGWSCCRSPPSGSTRSRSRTISPIATG